MRLVVVSRENPAASMVLARLRSASTGLAEFRSWMRVAGRILGVYIAGELEWRRVTVTTPLGVEAEEAVPVPPLLVSVLGAGEFLAQGILDIYPEAPLAFVAARRVEEGSGRPGVRVEYHRLPSRVDGVAVIADPMLATGGTVLAVARLLAERGADRVVIASVIASRPGVERLSGHPLSDRMSIVTLALDPELDSRAFIVPGLGDAGDRSLGVSA